jgi:hypothetical protein
MVDASYLAVAESASAKPIDVVEIDLPGLAGTKTFRFASADPIPTAARLGVDLLPYLLDAGAGSTTQIRPSDLKTNRGSVTVKMRDDENPEDFDAADTDLTTGSTFFRRLFPAFENWHKSEVRIYSFFDDSTLTNLSQAEPLFVGLLEDYVLRPDKTVDLVVRDKLEFRTTKVPGPISSDNTLAANISSTTATQFTVEDPDEIVDAPDDWPSRDFWLPAVKIDSEIMVIRDVTAGGNVRVARNRILHFSDFQNAAWSKTGGATAADGAVMGPRGLANGALITLPAGATLEQSSPSLAAASQDATGSFYLKEHPDNPGASLDIIVEDSTASESATTGVTVGGYWARDIRTIAFTGSATGNVKIMVKNSTAGSIKVYVAEASLVPATGREVVMPSAATENDYLGRGAFGTTAATHTAGAAVAEVVEYRNAITTTEGLHPLFIIRDLLNRSGIDPDDINQQSFDDETDFSTQDRFRRSLQTVFDSKKLVSEIRQLALIDLWADEQSNVKTRLSWRTFAAGEADEVVDEDVDIIGGPPTVKSGKQKRVTRPEVHWGFIGGSEGDNDDPDVYSNTELRIATDGEGPGLRSKLQKQVFGRWFYRAAEAEALQNRLIQRFLRGARSISFRMNFQRLEDIKTGQLIKLRSKWLVRDSSGSAVDDENSVWQVVSRKYPGDAKDFEVECLEHIQSRPAFIAPNDDLESSGPFPDYDNASDAERFYAFISNNDDPPTIPTAGDPPYEIQ